MFETLVLALDGSPLSEVAIPVATDLARQSGGRIVVVHVDERTVAKGDMPPVHPDEANLIDKVKGHAEAISAGGVETSVELDSVVAGGPAAKIAEIAGGAGADAIVIASRGESALKGMLLGSVAHKLLHVSPCPVLVIPAR